MLTVRPTHILSSVLIAGALLTSGCGGGEPTAIQPKPTEPPKPEYSAQQVASFFEDVTGDPLETDTNPSFDSLSVDHGDYDRANVMSERYGSFLIYVLRRPGSESIYKTRQGQPIKPDPQGVYWHDEGGSWDGDEALPATSCCSWTADEQVLGEGFERLDAVLSQLGKPAEQVRAALPESDQPCGEQRHRHVPRRERRDRHDGRTRPAPEAAEPRGQGDCASRPAGS